MSFTELFFAYDPEISEALKTNRVITDLSMSSNSIGTPGANALAEALKENRSIRTLKVSDLYSTLLCILTLPMLTWQLFDNPIGDPGACSIAEALYTNGTIRVSFMFIFSLLSSYINSK